ncbi:Crp/Fnr family transcriptional regulator [Diaphorobacter ruginosibacter]|uniref:Crp/Fnr family transcriptional regulator n=1 Tax=Diaphorobacter ruginosibacter TaxID=1715720 RepID=UPI003340AC3E
MTKVNSPEMQVLGMQRLRELSLFADVPEQEMAGITEGSACCAFQDEEFLFREGASAACYYLVLQGEVEVLRFGLDGEDRIFNVFGPGRLVAIAAMFMPHGRYPMNARARAGTVCLRLAREPLTRACGRSAPLAMRLLAMMSTTVYQHVNEVEWLTASTAPQRLARYLLKLGERQGDSLLLPLNQRQLAARQGVRAETLSRLLGDWQARGVVAGRGREWRIIDHGYLQQLAHAAERAF